MSTERMYDALKFTVGLRLDELRAQQQRAITVAAADGVLLGFVASVSAGAAGLSRVLIVIALVLLGLGLVAAAIAIWPRTMPGLGSANPALEADDAKMTTEMCNKLSATLSGPQLTSIYGTRSVAIAFQMALVGLALVLLIWAALVTNPSAAPTNTPPVQQDSVGRVPAGLG